MKRLIAIAITIAVFAAMILPTATVMASWQTFYESFDEDDYIFGAEGQVWGSYNPYTGYFSVSMRVQPTDELLKVLAVLHVNLDADNYIDLDEPFVEEWNAWCTPDWDDPVVLILGGIIPEWARDTFEVKYTVQTWVWTWPLGNYPEEEWHTTWDPAFEPVMEDFEWGSDGTSLSADGGDVDWTVTRMNRWWGYSVAEIDTAQKHRGLRSARLYRGAQFGDYIQAHYLENNPEYRGFYFKKDAGSNLRTTTGGNYGNTYSRIYVQVINVNGDQKLQYYYNGSWQGGWKLADYPPPPGADGWHLLEFKNISWRYARYDIYLNGNDLGRVRMMDNPTRAYNGWTAYQNPGAMPSQCWIDDIFN